MAGRGRPKAELALSDVERETLVRWSQRRKSAQALALRCRIVLACADGLSNAEVAGRLGVSRPTVGKWRSRFVVRRLEGLVDEDRPGAPRKISDDKVEEVVVATLEQAPKDATHWSRASMAKRSGLSKSTVGRIWPRRSSRARTRCSSRRSATWSACTWTHPSGRWCCAWTRSPRYRPWTGPSPCCR